MVREKRIKRVAGRAVLLLVVASMVLLTGCGVQQAQEAPTTPATPPVVDEQPVADPITYAGEGDDLVEIAHLDGEAMIMMLKGNEAERYFGVTSYDADGNYLDLLVNTTSFYDSGMVLLCGEARELEVNATGPWVLVTASWRGTDVFGPGETVTLGEGAPRGEETRGDWVFRVSGNPSRATITGNEAGGYFGVVSYDANMRFTGLLVNTTDPYQGTVRIPGGTALLVVNAEGSWSITLGE